MLKKTILLIPALLVGLVAVPAPGQADKAIFKCESTHSKEIGKQGTKRAKCLSKCLKAKQLKQETRSCTTPFDEETQACATKVEDKYKAKIEAKCPNAIPNCGPYTGFAPNETTAFAEAALLDVNPIVDLTVESLLYCADINDPKDTSQKNAFKCEDTVLKALNKMTQAILKCASKCAKRRDMKGETGIDCSACNLGTTTDQTMRDCVIKATDKANAKIYKKCIEKAGGFPNCGIYEGAESLADVTDFAFAKLCMAIPPRHVSNFCATP